MNKIYLGPWQFGKSPGYEIDRSVIHNQLKCWFRPILNSHQGLNIFAPPEIFLDRDEYYIPSTTAYAQTIGPLQLLKEWFDNLLTEKGYGENFGKVEFISQEQFDKLSVLI